MVKGLILVGVCAGIVLAASEHGLSTTWAASRAWIESERPIAGVAQTSSNPATSKPRIRGAADAQGAWLTAEHRGLTVHKTSTRSDRSMSIELRYGQDSIAIGLDVEGTVSVARGGTRVRVTTPEAFARLQQVLAGSEAAFAARLLHAEREAVSDLKAPEMSLLSVTAFVASLTGDIDAPRRLSTRFVEKHRGIYRPVRRATCFDEYTAEATAAWNDMQDCVNEANQDDSLLQRAYRRVACNAVWLLRSESAWIEYLGCLGPGQLIPQ